MLAPQFADQGARVEGVPFGLGVGQGGGVGDGGVGEGEAAVGEERGAQASEGASACRDLVEEVLPVGVGAVSVGPAGFLVSPTSITPSRGERTWTQVAPMLL